MGVIYSSPTPALRRVIDWTVVPWADRETFPSRRCTPLGQNTRAFNCITARCYQLNPDEARIGVQFESPTEANVIREASK